MKLVRLTMMGLAMLPANAFAADWRYLVTSTTETIVYVDISSIRDLPAIPISRPFPVRQIWSKSDHSNDNTETDRETKSMHRFDCSAETMLIVSTSGYRANGTVSYSRTNDDHDFRYQPVTPDSVGYALMEFACGRRALDPDVR